MVLNIKSPPRELIEAEKEYWEATRSQDFETIERLTAETLVLVQGEGVATFSRTQFVDMLRNDSFKLLSYELDESTMTFLSLGDTTAFLAYEVAQRYRRAGREGSGRSVNTSIWVRRGDVWQRAAHTISLR